jgi:hypothetical protein
MITSDAELEVVRKQLGRVEAALESLRRDVRPRNVKTYELMAESYVELLRSLRADVDAYLGIATAPARAPLAIALEGASVSLGQTSAGLITRAIDTFRRGLQSVVEVLDQSKKSDSSRRRPRWIERLCDLPLIGVVPGSVQVLLGEPTSTTFFSEDDQRALHNAIEVLFDGLEWAQGGDDAVAPTFRHLPGATQQAVLTVITQLLPPQSGPIQRVAFRHSPPNERRVRQATLSRHTRDRVRGELTRLAADRTYTEVEGVIRRIDLDQQMFVLRERPDNLPELPCEYRREIEEVVRELLDRRVIVSGTLETSRMTRREKMEAETIEGLSADEESAE